MGGKGGRGGGRSPWEPGAGHRVYKRGAGQPGHIPGEQGSMCLPSERQEPSLGGCIWRVGSVQMQIEAREQPGSTQVITPGASAGPRGRAVVSEPGPGCVEGVPSSSQLPTPRRAPRSRSRSGDRYRRGGRGPRHHSSSRSRSSWSLSPSRSRSLSRSRSPSPSRSRSRSPSRSRSQSRSPSPPREKLTRPAASPAVGEKLKK